MYHRLDYVSYCVAIRLLLGEQISGSLVGVRLPRATPGPVRVVYGMVQRSGGAVTSLTACRTWGPSTCRDGRRIGRQVERLRGVV